MCVCVCLCVCVCVCVCVGVASVPEEEEVKLPTLVQLPFFLSTDHKVFSPGELYRLNQSGPD